MDRNKIYVLLHHLRDCWYSEYYTGSEEDIKYLCEVDDMIENLDTYLKYAPKFKVMYMICKAFVDIMDQEGTTYGHDVEADIADKYIEFYEEVFNEHN